MRIDQNKLVHLMRKYEISLPYHQFVAFYVDLWKHQANEVLTEGRE